MRIITEPFADPTPSGPLGTVDGVSKEPLDPQPPREGHLFLDEVTDQLDRTFRLLRGDPDMAAESAFAEVGVNSKAEAQLLSELAASGPLAHPDRFPEANRLVMRALEVVDRDGWKHPKLRALGPLQGVAETAVEYVARVIVKRHVGDVAQQLTKLYQRRESQAVVGSPERAMIARARIRIERLVSGFGGGGTGLPTVLVGGAALPVLASIAHQAGGVSSAPRWLLIAGGVLLALLFGCLAWVMLQGAGLAHRRIKLSLLPALTALYETIGHCGKPPEDDSASLAAIAIGLTALAWFVVPLVIGGLVAVL